MAGDDAPNSRPLGGLSRLLEAFRRSELVRFGGVSVLALGIDLVVLVLLREFAGLPALVSAACGFLCGAMAHYVLSVHFVFRYRRLSSQIAEALSFAALSLAGLAILEGVMWGVLTAVPTHYLVGKGVATVFVFFFNFFAKKWLLFTPRGCAK